MSRRVGIVLFEGFELLDVFGPAEAFGVLRKEFELVLVAAEAGPVKSSQGPRAVADVGFADCPKLDLVLVPGGIGTRSAVENASLLASIRRLAEGAALVLSVCTGAALLARAGLLDGRRATTNKRRFEWVKQQGPRTQWVEQARFVEDGKLWTSSGVTAGIDMALAVIARLRLLGALRGNTPPGSGRRGARRFRSDGSDAGSPPHARLRGRLVLRRLRIRLRRELGRSRGPRQRHTNARPDPLAGVRSRNPSPTRHVGS